MLRWLRRIQVDEHGFTLPEILVTVILLGILFGIATSTWFGVVESRRVDSSTNQMVSELRRAHTSATNRLEDWKVDLQVNSDTYRIGSCPDQSICTAPLPATSERSLEEGTEVRTSGGGTIERVIFESNGEARIIGAGNIRIAADDGSPCHEIEINESTSRIKVTNVCV